MPLTEDEIAARYDEQGRLLAGIWPVWQEVEPRHVVDITLPWNGIEGPMNEVGERCAWPWEPQQLGGAPFGQYHCGYCGGMNVAGISHVEWDDESIAEWNAPYEEADDGAGVPQDHDPA